jgi:hypothetical protein
MKRGKPARGSPLPRSGPGYSGPAACLSSSLPSKVTYPSYESRDKVLAGLQSTIPSGAGIRGPLHPRRLRCPPSPYHRGVRLGRAHRRTGRIIGAHHASRPTSLPAPPGIEALRSYGGRSAAALAKADRCTASSGTMLRRPGGLVGKRSRSCARSLPIPFDAIHRGHS